MLLFYSIIIIIIFAGVGIYRYYLKPKRDPLKKANELSAVNKFLEATAEYKRALYQKPDAFDVHFKIADLYIKLENYEQAVFHLNEILRIDKYNLEITKHAVLKKLALSYYTIDEIEKAFQTFFDILKIEPEDAEAYYHISFIALGQEEFEIAQNYFETLVKISDDFESFFGAGITSYQNGKTDDAIKYFQEAIAVKPNSDIAGLAVSFALGKKGRYNEAISYLNKLIGRVTDDYVKFIAKRLMTFISFEAKKNREGLQLAEELLNFTREKKMEDEVKLSLFDVGFACIINNLLDKAYKYFDELYQLDNDYNDITEILNQVKKDITKGYGGDGFETTIHDREDDWISGAFSENFLWNICGLRSEKTIDIKNIIVPAKISKGTDTPRKDTRASSDMSDASDRIIRFCNLDNETFRMISNRLVIKLGNKTEEILHTYREADGVDIMSQSQDTEKVLVWVRRWKGNMVGEITLRNFAQAINDIRADKGIFITTAELTQAAQNSLSRLSKVTVINPNELSELLKGLI